MGTPLGRSANLANRVNESPPRGTETHRARARERERDGERKAQRSAKCPADEEENFTSHPVHVGRHVAGVLRGREAEIGVLVVSVALVAFGRHRH